MRTRTVSALVAVASLAVAIPAWLSVNWRMQSAVDPGQSAVLVTGASQGQGIEHIRILAQAGFRVYAAARSVSPSDDLGTNVVPLRMDITSAEDVRAAAKLIEEDLQSTGRVLTGLYCNAGVNVGGVFEVTDVERHFENHRVNVLGTMRVIQTFIPLLRASKNGRIVINGSVEAVLGMKFSTGYASSKYALQMIARILRVELKGSGIHIAYQTTGMVRTNMSFGVVAKITDTLPSLERDHPDIFPYYANMADPNEALLLGMSTDKAVHPSVVSNDMLEILTSARPKYDSYPGNVLGVPIHLLAFLSNHFLSEGLFAMQ